MFSKHQGSTSFVCREYNRIRSLAFMKMDTVPKHQRVYKPCIYPVACIIIVVYVDNNGVRHNCHELLAEFKSDVAKDGRFALICISKAICLHFRLCAISIIPKQERSPLIKNFTSIPCSLNITWPTATPIRFPLKLQWIWWNRSSIATCTTSRGGKPLR